MCRETSILLGVPIFILLLGPLVHFISRILPSQREECNGARIYRYECQESRTYLRIGPDLEPAGA